VARARRDPLATGWPGVLWLTGAVLFVAMLAHVAALALTGGPVSGPVSLRKPAAFAETGWLLAWSVALLLPTLRTREWQRHVVRATTVLFALGETAIIGLQAWRGVPSHYNFSTPFDTALMRGGAAGTAGLFLIGVLVLLVAALRSGGGSASQRLGVRAGLVVLLIGCAIGFVMVSNNSGVYQGHLGAGFRDRTSAYLGPSVATVGPEYLLLRPSTDGGDLVLLHAIGVHGLVLLAAPALLLAGTAMSPGRQLLVVGAAVVGVMVAMGILAVQALLLLPLSRLDPLALAALAACAAAYLASFAAVGAAVLRDGAWPALWPRSQASRPGAGGV